MRSPREKINLRHYLILMLFFLIQTQLIIAQIGIQTDSPDPSSALDIVSTDKGLLIPRVELTNDLTAPAPVNNPATGLLVYNSGANQSIGFYFWTGSAWLMLQPDDGTILRGSGISTDNATVRFDGADGNKIQNSTVIIDDAGNVSGINNITTAGFTLPTNAGIDKVLRSDASGNGTWMDSHLPDIEEENVVITPNASTINFQGAVDVVDNGGNKATISITQTISEEQIIQVGSTSNKDLNNLITPVNIPWDIEMFKDVATFVHSNTVNSNRISVLYRGTYEINYMFSIINDNNQRKTLRSRIRVNGLTYIPGSTAYAFTYSSSDDKSSLVSSSFLLDLQAGDYIEIMVNGQTNVGPVNLIPNESLLFVRILRSW